MDDVKIMFKAADVNLARVQAEIAALSEIGKQPSGGMTRYTFSAEHQEVNKLVADWMTQAGLHVYFDRWGNLFGRTTAEDSTPIILSGSHLDSVPNGGNYDGPLGVLSALEAVRLILESGATLPLEVVSFIEEEGARFSGLLGSRLATNSIPNVEAIIGRDGVKFVDALAAVDFPYPVNHEIDLTQRVESYVELHIEQGRRLENAGIPIGAVTAIAGPNFMKIKLIGRSDHAGATDYADRHDTLLAAAEIIVGIRERGVEQFTGKGHMTVGSIDVRPNVVNVVAGETNFEVDFRAANDTVAIEMKVAIEELLQEAAAKHGLTYEIILQSIPAAHTPARILKAIKKAGEPYQELISWAAHDAMVMANVCDAGMIFVPCVNGRSHTPEEFTKAEDIASGIAVLANTLLELATK